MLHTIAWPEAQLSTMASSPNIPLRAQ
ncbi:hypothetical protein E2C01_061829 [Portunus trituberculatus]|uniref:Uncharacterized protein n=1 Tax=Portunus trituberculatus TaxID=210409 RepID=A0A5B7H4X6_PORTR|nr:hypothetical protein [Portunus trituberculatus]